MNNFERIKNMNEDEMIMFLNGLIGTEIEKTVVYKWFDKNYCKLICPDIEVIHKGKNEIWKECYFEGLCPYQDWGCNLIKLWLESENEEI